MGHKTVFITKIGSHLYKENSESLTVSFVCLQGKVWKNTHGTAGCSSPGERAGRRERGPSPLDKLLHFVVSSRMQNFGDMNEFLNVRNV